MKTTPSIIYTTYALRVAQGLKPNPAEAGYTLDRSPVYDKADI